MELSISIVSYNTKESLRECIFSILKNIKDIEYEIIVVDNGSIDGSVQMLKQEFPSVKLIENKHNAFFTVANNQAMRESNGQYILLLNSDTVICDNTIKDMLYFMEHNPEAGAVGGRMLFPDGRVQNTCWKFHSPIDLIFNQEPFRSYIRRRECSLLATSRCNTEPCRQRQPVSASPKEVDVVSDAFILLRRDAIFQIGLYDEKFLLYYTEDDICHRLRDMSWKVYYFPQTSIIHKLFGSSKKVSGIKMNLIRKADTLRYCAKYYNWFITMVISSFLLLGFLVEILKLIVKICRNTIYHIHFEDLDRKE